MFAHRTHVIRNWFWLFLFALISTFILVALFLLTSLFLLSLVKGRSSFWHSQFLRRHSSQASLESVLINRVRINSLYRGSATLLFQHHAAEEAGYALQLIGPQVPNGQ